MRHKVRRAKASGELSAMYARAAAMIDEHEPAAAAKLRRSIRHHAASRYAVSDESFFRLAVDGAEPGHVGTVLLDRPRQNLNVTDEAG